MKCMAKRICALFFAVLACIAVACSPASATSDATIPGEVLLVCDTQQEIDTLGALIRACGLRVDAVLAINYAAGQAQGYPFLVTTSQEVLTDAAPMDIKILCIGAGFDATGDITFSTRASASLSVSYDRYTQPPKLAKDVTLIASHTGESLATVESASGSVPFAALFPARAYVPYYQENDVSILALGAVMQRFFASEAEGGMYIMIDEVYPFSDLGALGETAKYLYENAVPFIVRIMPVYDNLEYPAFSRYAQVLRYVQSHGGSIVLHGPLVDLSEPLTSSAESRLAQMTAALDRQGVVYYPWEIDPYPLDIQLVQSINAGEMSFGALPFDTVIQFPLASDQAETVSALDRISRSWLTLSDYRRRFTEDNIVYEEMPLDETYAYQTLTEGSLSGAFNIANRTLLWLVGISLVLFAVILLISRRIYRGKFF